MKIPPKEIVCEGPNCTVIFAPKRATGRFHSAACRTAAAREAGVDAETGEVLSDGKSPQESKKSTGVKSDGERPYDKEKALKAFIKMGVADVQWISTGIADFDKLTQIPKGRVTHIFGPEGVGKTTLCLNMIKGLKDKKVFYVDSEASLNPYLLVDLELDPTKFHLYNESSYFEDIAEAIRSAAKSGEYEMVIFDSLAACTTRAETEGKITDRNIGQKAFFMHKLLHMTQMEFKNSNTAFIVINQERDKIGSYFDEKYTPGGKALPYAASLSIRLKTTKSARFPTAPKGAKKHLYLGHEVEATIIKSKVNQPWRVGKFKLFYANPVEQEVESDAPVTNENF